MTITVQITDTFEEWRLKNNALSQNFSNLSNNVFTVNVIASGNITAGANITTLGNVVVSQDIVGAGNLRLSQGALITGNVTAANIRANVHYQTHVTSKPAINVIFTGNITGSSNIAVANSGTNILTIYANVAADSVTLGTHTIGDYVKSISSADTNNVIVSGGSGEGSTPTVNLAMTAVTPAIYGNSSVTPSFTVDRSGRITAASNNLITPHYLDVTNKPSINVNFTGDVTGKANVNLTTNNTNLIDVALTVQPNSVALGTDTTGDYVASISSADTANIIVSSGSGEGSAPTVNLAMTGVTPTTYGSANIVPVVTVDRAGRITSASNVTIDRKYSLTSNKPSVNLKFSGDVTGTANLNLTNENTNFLDVSLSMNADSIELGVDTTGRYTANVLPGTMITVSGTADEGNAITINHADTSTLNGAQGGSGIAAFTVDDRGHVTAVTTATYLTDTVTTTAASYGNANVVSQITLDTKGRITGAANVAIDRDYALTTRKPSINLRFVGEATGTGNLSLLNSDKNELAISMTVASIGSGSIPTTTVSPGTYGGANVFSAFTVDATGRLTAASNVALNLTLGNDTSGNYVQSISSADTANIIVSNGSGEGSTPTVNLAMTGVTPTRYGNSSVMAEFTVDRSGRISSAANTKITPHYLDITNKPAVNINFTGDVTGKANVNLSSNNTNLVDVALTIATNSVALGTDTTGNYTDRVVGGTGISATGTADEGNVITVGLTTTGVTARTYGNASIVPVITVDAQGRITSASNVTISAGGGGAIGVCNSNNLTSTTLTTHPNITGACHNFFAGVDSGKCITSGSFNTFIGFCTGFRNTIGEHNNMFGLRAGCCNTTGSYNNFFGRCAGLFNESGCSNNFFGSSSGRNNTTGSHNNFFGTATGTYNTSGCFNTFIGLNAGQRNIFGCYNTFIGKDSGMYNTSGCYNHFFGRGSGYYNTTGCHNNFIGVYAGRKNTTGSHNNFFGFNAGRCNTTGRYNNFIGVYAGRNNTTGSHNNFFGVNAGSNNTTGSCNLFAGWEAGCCTNTGRENVFLGTQAGKYNTSGCFNLFFGTDAGRKNTTANFNVFIGYNTGYNTSAGGCNTFVGSCNAGYNNTTGTNNSFFGGDAGYNNTTGCLNSFFGDESGYNTSTGVRNVFAGFRAGRCNTSGNRNIALGHDAGANVTTGNDNIVLGYLSSCAGFTGSTSNVIILATGGIQRFEIDSTCNNIMMGTCAGNALVTGQNNILIGQQAGLRLTTGCHNTFIGSFSGQNNVTGDNNIFIGCAAGFCSKGGVSIFIGKCAGYKTSTTSNNIFIGNNSGACNSTGADNVFLGSVAGWCNDTGCYNIFVGNLAGRNNASASCNTFIGYGGGYNNLFGCGNHFFGYKAGYCNTDGNDNTAIGSDSGYYLTTGINNIFIGYASGFKNTIGKSNTFFGCLAGYQTDVGNHNIFAGQCAGYNNTSGSNNIAAGQCAGGCVTTGSNNIFMGCAAGISFACTTTQSNRIVMGNSSHTLACVAVAWTAVSDIRDKCIFGPVPHGRGFLANVNPITYSFKNRETNELTDDKKRYGFSAQEILALEGDDPVLVGNDNPEKLGLTTDYIVPILVNAVKEMSEELKQLRAEIEELKKRV